MYPVVPTQVALTIALVLDTQLEHFSLSMPFHHASLMTDGCLKHASSDSCVENCSVCTEQSFLLHRHRMV